MEDFVGSPVLVAQQSAHLLQDLHLLGGSLNDLFEGISAGIWTSASHNFIVFYWIAIATWKYTEIRNYNIFKTRK